MSFLHIIGYSITGILGYKLILQDDDYVHMAFYAHIRSLCVIGSAPPHLVTPITIDIEKPVLDTRAVSSPLI